MQLKLRLLALLAVGLAAAASAWLWWAWPRLVWQWASYRVGAAATYEQARSRLAWFERSPDQAARLRELVRRWGTGNRRFDLYLARYVDDPASSEALREAFSRNLAWRDDLPHRWASYWSWRPGPEPQERIQSIAAYLDVLAAAEPTRNPTWRELLDVQAVFTLTGTPRLAVRLSPDNWRQRYRQWLQQRPRPLPKVARPAEPFPKE